MFISSSKFMVAVYFPFFFSRIRRVTIYSLKNSLYSLNKVFYGVPVLLDGF